MESESPVLKTRKSNKSNGQGAERRVKDTVLPRQDHGKSHPRQPPSPKYQWALPALCFCWMRFATNIEVSRNLSAVNVHFRGQRVMSSQAGWAGQLKMPQKTTRSSRKAHLNSLRCNSSVCL